MKKRFLTTTQTIVLSFLLVIIAGGLVLTLPFMSADGTWTPVVDAMFTSTTSVCVTGLVTVTTATHWSLAGKVFILILIQIGGMGTITVMMMMMMALHRKISLRNRMLIENAFNLDTLQGLVRFLLSVFKGVLFAEVVGAIAYSFVFVPDFGFGKGLWYSLFHSVSAFCNAGLDIIGGHSFAPYAHNIWINIVTIVLVISGGLGFTVWNEIVSSMRKRYQKNQELAIQSLLRELSQHTKVVLVMTGVLIVGGTLLFLLFEYNNPATLGNETLGNKIMMNLFQYAIEAA